MTKKDCPHYEDCNAPLCPMDEEHSRAAIWYADEEVCRKRVGMPKWVRVQKKIQRKTSDPDRGYFSYTMLATNPAVYPGVRGVNPDSQDRAKAEAAWLKGHRGVSGARGSARGAQVAALKAWRDRSVLASRTSADDPGRSGHVEGGCAYTPPSRPVFTPEDKADGNVPFLGEKRQQEE